MNAGCSRKSFHRLLICRNRLIPLTRLMAQDGESLFFVLVLTQGPLLSGGRDQTTLEELVHEGLLRVLEDRRTRRQPFRLRSIEPVGGSFQADFADGDWQQIRDEIYRGRGT